MDNRTKRYIDIYINGKQVENDVRGINQAIKKLTNEQARMTIGSREYVESAKKIRTLNGMLNEHRQQLRNTGESWLSLNRIAESTNKYFTMVTGAIAVFTGVAYSISQWVQGNVGLSDSLADVMKTTGMTRKEVRELYTEFQYLNTRTPRTELLKLAEEAGRLGKKSKKEIMDFVEVANMISVALGDDLGGNAEEATREVGKFTDNLRVGQQYGVDAAAAMNKVGSGINEVAANSKANAGYIIEWTKRTQGLGHQANITAADLFGMAATFDESGQNVEMSATAVNQVLVNMFEDTAAYAKVAGMSVKDFAKLLNTDANEAFIKMLEGLNGNNEGFGILVQKFESLDIDGARATQALASIASNIDRLRINQKTANTAMEEGVSLMNEYSIRNENLAGNVAIVGRAIHAWFINSTMLSWLESVVGKMAEWAKVPLSDKLEAEQLKLAELSFVINDVNTSNSDRLKLFAKLKDISPDIVKGIDSENISMDILNKNLVEYNNNLLNRIIIQKKQEEIDEVGRRSTDYAEGAAEYQLEAVNKMNNVRAELAEKSKELAAEYDSIMGENIPFSYKVTKVIGLADRNDIGTFWLHWYQSNSDKFQQIAAKYAYQANEMVKKRDELAKQLGLYVSTVPEVVDSGTGGGAGSGSGGGGGINDPKSAAEEAAKRAAEIYKKGIELRDKGYKLEKESMQRLNELYNEFFRLRDEFDKAMSEPFPNEEEERVAEPEVDKAVTEFLEKSIETRREILDNFYKNGAITYKEYLSEIEKLDQEHGKKLLQIFQQILEFAQMAQQVYSAWSNLQQAEDEADYNKYVEKDTDKRKRLETRLKSGEISHRDYYLAIQQMDEELNDRQKRLEYETAKRRKEQALFSAIISTAQAVINGLNTQPFMPLGIAMGALAGVLGGLQIAAISKEPVPEYFEGGYTTGDKVYRAGEKGKREYIAPGWQVEHPQLGPIIEDLNRIRNGRNPLYINSAMPLVSPYAASAAQGFSSTKNYTSSTSQVTHQHFYSTPSDDTELQKKMALSIIRLEKHMMDPENRRAYISNDLNKSYAAEMNRLDSVSRMQ